MIKPKDRVNRSWLKDMRKDRGLTTREIAEIFGISYQHYSDIETGRRNPSIKLSMEVANFFDFPVAKLLEERTTFIKRQEKAEKGE